MGWRCAPMRRLLLQLLRRPCCSRLRSLTGKTSGLIEEIWDDTLSPTVRFFLEQLLSAGHLRLLPLVTDRFLELADRAAGRHKVEARFACDPQEGELGRVRHLITAAYGPDFTFDVRVDPALLAGVFLRIDDRVVDATLAGRLARLKRDLMKPMRPDAAVNGQNKESL